MSGDVPFPALDSPPPMYEDIFATDGEPGDTEDGWDGVVDPQLFASSNLFSADPPADQGATPGALIFPDLPALGGRDGTLDLFGSQGVVGAIGGSTASSAATSKDASPVSFLALVALSGFSIICPKVVS